MTDRHWSETQEKTSSAGIALLLAAFRLGGRTLFHISLWPVILFYWLASPAARRASRQYLAHVSHTRNKAVPRVFASLRHTWRFADTILDKLLAVSGFFRAKDLDVRGADELTAAARGAVLITAHTGCLELCQFLGEAKLAQNAATQQRSVYVLTHTRHAARFSDILSKLNPKFAVRHLQVADIGPQTAVRLSELVEAGHWIVIVADRTPIGSNACLQVPFLGEEAPFALGAFLLPVLLRCPAWSMICTRQTDPRNGARYRVRFTRIYDGTPVARTERAACLRALAESWVKTLQESLLASPLDWFNFFDFWHPPASGASRRTRQRRAPQR